MDIGSGPKLGDRAGYIVKEISQVMRITFLFTVAGCETSCRHCHSAGGRGPNIELDRFKTGIDRLVPIIRHLEATNDVDIDWNYEPLAHPDFHRMLGYVREKLPHQESSGYYWPTSGAPFATNPNIADILREIKARPIQKPCTQSIIPDGSNTFGWASSHA